MATTPHQPNTRSTALDPVLRAALAPINGVDLATYAWVTTQVANHGYRGDQASAFAAQRGIDHGDWTVAAIGWRARLEALPELAVQFRTCLDAS